MNGSVSDWVAVKAAYLRTVFSVPSYSWPLLMILPGAVSSIYAVYADDMKVHGPVNNSEDGDKLQKDLDALIDWTDTWQPHFNADKCKVLHMGKNNEERCYKMRKHGSSDRVSLEKLEIEGDLGVQVDKDLRFSQHIETQVNKTNKLLGLIRRSYEHLNAVVCCTCMASLKIW